MATLRLMRDPKSGTRRGLSCWSKKMKAIETKQKRTGESEIRTLIDDWVKSLSAKNIDAILAHYADDVVAYDVPSPLQVNGREGIRHHLESWLNMFKEPIRVEFRDQNITVSGDLAVLRHLARVYDASRGPESGNWVRVTVCYQKRDGKWLVVHEHASIPAGLVGN